ncbi:MAG: hypothetical protein M1818_001939 [Claussenomyces sp. TS43310]|nr:MAG: hypothetical protein M1818_001939 [Claussenomyces sp. TS43310]
MALNTGVTEERKEDHWSSEAYQSAAAFVPRLASKVVTWLDVQPGDRIWDVGCGDGILTQQIAQSLTTGHIHGTDASPSMIRSAQQNASGLNTTYAVHDATTSLTAPAPGAAYTKVFSNAALHWILRAPATRRAVFDAIFDALEPGGTLVFEMGGFGNVAELRAVLLAAVARRVGIDRARRADPWFFPDEAWMRTLLRDVGFVVDRAELEYRPTPCQQGPGGGLEGWLRLMGKQFFDALGDDAAERNACLGEVMRALETVCRAPSGGDFLSYVRLRVKATKP